MQRKEKKFQILIWTEKFVQHSRLILIFSKKKKKCSIKHDDDFNNSIQRFLLISYFPLHGIIVDSCKISTKIFVSNIVSIDCEKKKKKKFKSRDNRCVIIIIISLDKLNVKIFYKKEKSIPCSSNYSLN